MKLTTPDYRPAPGLLKDRVILITGAGDGIGRTAALTCAEYGATVILLGRTQRKLERVYDEIDQAGHPQAVIHPLDLEKAGAADYAQLAGALEQQFGHLDGLLHNAAILGTLTPLGLYDVELWHKVMQVNLHAPFLLTRACLKLLRQAADASVIFTSDATGREGRAYWGAYGVSKAGLEGMMRILADETESEGRVRVNSIDPGALRTMLRARAYPAENPNQLPTPETVMNSYLYLLGPDSRHINGRAFTAQENT